MLFFTITAAAVAAAATATAAWVLCSCFSLETVESHNRSTVIKESQNKSSETKELRRRLLETMEDLNYPHLELQSGPMTIHLQSQTEASLPVKDGQNHFVSKQSFKQKEEVHDRNSWRLKGTQKLKADANKQIPKHLTPNSYNHIENSERHNKIQFDKSYEDRRAGLVLRQGEHGGRLEQQTRMGQWQHQTLGRQCTGVQTESTQVGSEKVKPLSLKKHRKQKKRQPDNQKSQKVKCEKKLKVDGGNQISRRLTPNIHIQETIKIMSYNIWSVKHYKREKRMNAVNHLIEQHSPDIILLQEVTPEVYIYFKSCNWWEVYKCSINEKQATKQFFCLMLSKLPVKKFIHKPFVNTKTCKAVSVAKITSNSNKTLTVATCHLKSPNDACTYIVERTSQAKEAIGHLKFSPNVVLGGDMNWDESTDGPFPLTSGWSDAWSDLKPEEEGYTYDMESNAMRGGRRHVLQKRFDRFVCRLKDFDMIDIEIVGTEAIKGVSCKSRGKKLPLLPSDHYGLILTICAK